MQSPILPITTGTADTAAKGSQPSAGTRPEGETFDAYVKTPPPNRKAQAETKASNGEEAQVALPEGDEAITVEVADALPDIEDNDTPEATIAVVSPEVDVEEAAEEEITPAPFVYRATPEEAAVTLQTATRVVSTETDSAEVVQLPVKPAPEPTQAPVLAAAVSSASLATKQGSDPTMPGSIGQIVETPAESPIPLGEDVALAPVRNAIQAPVAATTVQEPRAFSLTPTSSEGSMELRWPLAEAVDEATRVDLAPRASAPTPQQPVIPVVGAMVIAAKEVAIDQSKMVTSVDADPVIAALEEAATRPETARAVTQMAAGLHTRADLPVNVARQIADVMQRSADRAIELQLQPAELGRVRLSLSPAEAGITVSIMAERPETLDLMRRNIQSLEQAFGELGYTSIDFAFQGGNESQSNPENMGGRDEHREASGLALEFAEPQTMETPPLQPAMNLPADGLDVRI